MPYMVQGARNHEVDIRNTTILAGIMEDATVDSVFSCLKSHSRWTSDNIVVPVFSSIDSDDVIELDICRTLRGAERGRPPPRLRIEADPNSSEVSS
jgi:hypothetical protein